MKKRLFSVIALIGILVFMYLDHSYTSIYNKIGDEALQTPSDFGNYAIGTFSKSLTYVAIGDSLTAGVGVDSYIKSYPYIFAEKISQKNNTKVNLIPFALSGARSAYTLDNLVEPAIKTNPDIITLFIGVNDVHGNISEKEFEDNYENILKRITQETGAKIYIINLPYIGTSELIKTPFQFYFNTQTKQFNSIIKALAQKYNVEYVDLYEGHSRYADDAAYYSADLFHPNQTGYALWADILYANFSK